MEVRHGPAGSLRSIEIRFPYLSYGRGVDHIVEAVLTESDEPLHYSTISALATDREGRRRALARY